MEMSHKEKIAALKKSGMIKPDFNNETKAIIIANILDEVEKKDSARVGYHAEQVLKIEQFKVAPNTLSKIEAKIIQNKRYISRPYFKSQGDYEILKNPNYKNEIWQDIRKGLITAIFSLLVGTALYIIANQKQARIHRQQGEKIDSLGAKILILQNQLRDSL